MNPIKIGKLKIGIFESFLFLFVCAKLTHTIDWSWFWVLSPGWIALSLGAIEGLAEYFEERALSPEKLDEIVKNSTVDRLVINTTDNVGLPTYPNSILDVKGSLNSEDT